jgi:hypothetical protein
MSAAITRGGVVLAALLAAAACTADDADSGGIGIRINDEAAAKDAGLPHYPGSTPYKDDDDSSSGANIRLSTASFGFKVVALNLQTPDKPERVAAFYRKALSKYGRVLDCSDGASKDAKSEPSSRDDNELGCDDDDGGSHSIVYKVGTEDDQRVVGIKPHGAGARFSLAHVQTRGEKK